MRKTILIFAYYSYKDPVFQSAVLPYFINFPDQKLRFVLLTFEHDAFPVPDNEVREIESFLLGHRIIWRRTKWRSGQWKPFKKFLDLTVGLFKVFYLVIRYRVGIIYSEGLPGAIIGHYGSVLTGTNHVVHSFEPHADYMIEAGIWKGNSWEARILIWHEGRIARRAKYVFTATALMIERLKGIRVKEESLFRVPSCVDINHFQFSRAGRVKIRVELAISQHETVLVYLGKFGGMYMEEEAFEFFKLCQQKLSSVIMILTPDGPVKIHSLAEKYSLNKEKLIIRFLNRKDVPDYLSAADIGFVAVRPWPSKKFCSPIKTGEYLACGLPVIVPKGVSDDAETLQHLGIGIAMEGMDLGSYEKAIAGCINLMGKSGPEAIRHRSREYVLRERAVNKYQELYSRLFNTILYR